MPNLNFKIDHDGSFGVSTFIAGDIHTARESLRRQCVEEGLCVSYGAEEGIRIGFVNYPRFPKLPIDIQGRAIEVAKR
jgi:hypothetical protein